MMTNITLDNIKLAVQRIAIACEQSQNRLCEADSQLGDGDLGVTMQKGWRQIANAVSYTHLTLPTNVSMCRSRWSPYH